MAPASQNRPRSASEERRDREEEEERLAVDGTEKERGRRDREEENGVPRGLARLEVPAREPVEQHECGRPGRECDEHARQEDSGRTRTRPRPTTSSGYRGKNAGVLDGQLVAVLQRSAGTTRCPSAPRRPAADPSSSSRELSHSPRRVLSAPSNPTTMTSGEQPDRCAAPEEQPERGRRGCACRPAQRDSNARPNQKGGEAGGRSRHRIRARTMATIAA